MLQFIIWNGSPELFSYGQFALRWYGLLFALGFLVSQQILYYIYRKEGKPEKDVDTLTIYMIVATILGARLGHVIFYQPEIIWESPLSVFIPFEFNPFRFTGFQGLASHGGAIGILFALWLFSRKKKPGQNYLQVLDRIVILVCLTGCFIRLGNFFNSEILGKPSSNPLSVVFVNKVSENLTRDNSPVEYVTINKSDAPEAENSRMPINITILFKKGVDETRALGFMGNEVKYYLTQLNEYVDESALVPLKYQWLKEPDGSFAARVHTFGIARHPAQLYESISCLLLFAFLLWYWSRYKINLPEGRIFGMFMIVLWSLRFAYEFLKISQVPFEDKMTLNMGQILSIPLVLVGVYVLIRSYKKPSAEIQSTT
ncbi:MAG: prolipoprotein diacylglyceryl transferase [Bacteroidetes bacterium]|nr:prolipoprotein diacylglyceryl transferase [Bacteroidota bacterium]MBI3482340.1 prolipoprotein diacylglyceryl transferase [Bacteroidota bacterium]